MRALPRCAARRAHGDRGSRIGVHRRRRPRDPHLPQAGPRLRRRAPCVRSRGRDPRNRKNARGRRGGRRRVRRPDSIRHRAGRGGRLRLLKVGATLVVTGLCTAYILWKIDLGKTGHVLAHARVGWWLAALAIMVASVWPMAWRWPRLVAARGVHDPLPRLVRTYFVGYAAGQVLPTALGGDASRIY